LDRYGLDAIGYARAIVFDESIVYFERELVTKDCPELFKAGDFEWRWAKPKTTAKKEQLPALHGYSRSTGKKSWAWHGLGENQLHFSGEAAWWPQEGDPHRVSIQVPSPVDQITFGAFVEWVTTIGKDVPTQD
jgi:hypothetical protein